MFGLITILSMVFSAKELIKERIEPVAPATMRFDWDAYYDDMDKMSVREQMKKSERGGYWTTKPIPKKVMSMEDVVDVERYKREKELYGDVYVEMRRKNGCYRHVRKYC